MNILIVAAHPDDETLGCGGAIARYASEGHRVYVAILGEGITSRFPRREDAPGELLEQLRQNARNALAVLGARDVRFFDFPDNRFDTAPMLEIVKTVEGVVREVRPELVLTHHGHDLNIDHALTFRATLTATRPLAETGVRELLSFEVGSSTDISFGRCGGVFSPNVFLDISAHLETKIAAMRRYETEARPLPHPRSPEAIRALAVTRGASAHLAAAEAFELVRRVDWAGTS